MPVPEAAMHEDDSAAPRKRQIRASWQILTMQPEAKAQRMQPLAQQHFRLRVLAADAAHIKPPLIRSEDVHHLGIRPPSRRPPRLSVRPKYP